MKIIITMFLAVFIIPMASGTVMHQDCDGEQRTCCIPENYSGVQAMWVNDSTCPKGMVDDATCVIQFGCKQNDQPELN